MSSDSMSNSSASLMAGASSAYQQAQGSSSSSVMTSLNRKGMSKEQAKKAAQDFESFFLSQTLKPMFDTVKTDEMFGGGEGEDMWKSLLVDEYAKQLAKKGGLGIAEQVMKVMLRDQESGPDASSAPTAAGQAAGYQAASRLLPGSPASVTPASATPAVEETKG